ncbi:MAG: hypothetical protein ACE5IW_09020 [bacterium]
MKRITTNEEIVKQKDTDAGIENIETRVALIQALIPIGLQYVNELLQQEVESLVGPRYGRHKGAERRHYRWGRQRGSVYLGDQKVAVNVPRVRNFETGKNYSSK